MKKNLMPQTGSVMEFPNLFEEINKLDTMLIDNMTDFLKSSETFVDVRVQDENCIEFVSNSEELTSKNWMLNLQSKVSQLSSLKSEYRSTLRPVPEQKRELAELINSSVESVSKEEIEMFKNKVEL